MKSILAIVFCALSACGALGLFLYQSGNGQLATVLGKPPISEGTLLFPVNKKAISKITIQIGDSDVQQYRRRYSFWSTMMDESPVRADYVKLEALLYLISTAQVVQPLAGPPENYGDPIKLTFTSDTGEYFSTTLVCQLPLYTGLEEPFAPTFVIKFQDGRYYACTSELTENYPDLNADSLVDHKPFFFHKALLREITYRHDSQIVTLSKSLPNAPWRITAPLNLRADEKKVKEIINNLYNLEAEKLSEKPLTIKEGTPSFTIKSFTTEIPTQSLLLPTDTEGFLKTQPYKYHFSPEQLEAAKISIDEVRSKTITDSFVKKVSGKDQLDIGKINSILLQSPSQNSPVTLAILKSPNGTPRWNYNNGSGWRPANEIGVANLFQALTSDPVDGFSLESFSSSTEAEKSLTITFKDGTKQHFDLFRSEDKRILIQERGADFSMFLNSSHANKIETNPTGWKDNIFWDVNGITLKGLQRHVLGKSMENYTYNFNLEKWTAEVDNKDVTQDLDNVAANALLATLQSLYVNRWIPAEKAGPSIEDATPVGSIIALSEVYDDFGDTIGISQKQLLLYRNPSSQKTVIIALVQENEPVQYGLIDKDVALYLIKPLIYEE